jgi:hypothetical protein
MYLDYAGSIGYVTPTVHAPVQTLFHTSTSSCTGTLLQTSSRAHALSGQLAALTCGCTRAMHSTAEPCGQCITATSTKQPTATALPRCACGHTPHASNNTQAPHTCASTSQCAAAAPQTGHRARMSGMHAQRPAGAAGGRTQRTRPLRATAESAPWGGGRRHHAPEPRCREL